jgi:hypothetical protein
MVVRAGSALVVKIDWQSTMIMCFSGAVANEASCGQILVVGVIFRHPKYSSWGLKEWSNLSTDTEEMVNITARAGISCYVKLSTYSLPVQKFMYNDGKGLRIPKLWESVRFCGFGLKKSTIALAGGVKIFWMLLVLIVI